MRMNRVLVVDDEKLVRQGIITTFPWEKHGFAVAGEAGSGEKALELLERESFDLLVTDLTMNGMSGLELIERARRIRERLPVVVLTCHDNFQYIQKAMRLGVLDYIMKTEIEDEAVEETLTRIAGKLKEGGTNPAAETGGIMPLGKGTDILAEAGPADEGAAETDASAGTGRPPGGASAPDGEDVRRLRADWNATDWVNGDERFEELLRRTSASGMDAAGMRRLFYPVVLEWERLLNGGALNDFLRQSDERLRWRDWERWLRGFRDGLRRTVERNANRQIADAVFEAIEHMRASLGTAGFDASEADIAGAVNMSRGHFSKSFKRVTGKSYGQYVRLLKLERAKEMLLRTDEPITRVAESCGFSDYRHFSRVFREYAGMLPTDFRKAGPAD